MSTRPSPGTSFAFLFLLSGFVGVLVEQIFERLLSVLVGGSTPASALVLVVYFAGLSIGGFAATRLARVKNFDRARGYAFAELAVAVACAAVLIFFEPMQAWFAPILLWGGAGPLAKVVSRVLITLPVVFPAAFAMGVSFPLLSGIAAKIPGSGNRYVARLYTMNLFGAAAAAVLAPYGIFPFAGLSGGLVLCAVIDLFVGLAALKLSTGFETTYEEAVPSEHAGAAITGAHVPVLLIAFTSGLVFFALEVTWTYLVAVVVNSSVYAFSSMLFTVLLGLGLGAHALSTAAARKKDQSNIGFLFLACAAVLFMQMALWPAVPGSMASMGQKISNFYLGEVIRWFHLALIMLPVTFLYGMIYPLIFNDTRFSGPGCSRLLGYATSVNAVGSVIGALAAFFVLFNYLGAEKTLRMMIVVLAACGLGGFVMDKRYRALIPGLAAAAVLLFAVLKFPAWDKLQLTSGLNVYFKYMNVKKGTKLLFFNEHSYGGVTTVVSNIEEGVNTKVLLTNGKFQGDDGEQTQAQIALAALPTMQLANRHDALVIGFGTGQSAGMLADFGYSAVDIAEISPGILEASRVHFAGLNQNVLSNSRANVFVEDGRNVLLTRPKQYDLIAIEVSSIWFAGATNIYSREFYELAKARLKPRGVIQQWIQLHHITPREIGTIMGTIHGSFRYVTLWYFGGQGIIIASEHPQAMEPAGYAAVYQSMLRQFKNDGNKAQAFTKALSSSQLLDSEGVSRLAARHRDTNTDWNRWLEYWTPTYALSEEDWPTINVTALLKYRSPATSAEVR